MGEEHIVKAATEFPFKASVKKCPLTLDMMKLRDVKTSGKKNYGGIAGRIAGQLNLLFDKEVLTDGSDFKCMHCNEILTEESLLNSHLEKSHEDFYSKLLMLFPQAGKRLEQHIIKGINEVELKVPTGEEEEDDEEEEFESTI